MIALVKSDQKVRTLPEPMFGRFSRALRAQLPEPVMPGAPGPRSRNHTVFKSRWPKTSKMPLARTIVPPEIECV